MSTVKVLEAKLLGSWPSLKQVPDFGLPEVAMIGRSNVGKSSLINKLVGRKALAKVSSTPGKTKLAVLFEIELLHQLDGVSEKRRVVLVDLPGYGFAKVDKQTASELRDLIAEYLKKRKALRAICLLNDCRRTPSEDEFYLWNLAKIQERKLALLITKTDKLNRSNLQAAIKQISGAFDSVDKILASGLKEKSEDLQNGVYSLLF